jgi:hypothetical protein
VDRTRAAQKIPESAIVFVMRHNLGMAAAQPLDFLCVQVAPILLVWTGVGPKPGV